MFLNCFCCVCVVFSDVDYNTTLPRVCQQVFFFFLQLESNKEIISSLLFPNTKKAGTDSFSSIPALKPRYPLDNTSFSGCQLFRFRNKISFFSFFILSYPLCFYYLVVCWFILQEHLFLFWFLFVCLHFFDKIDYSVIQIPLIIFPKYKYHVFLSASLRFFSFSLGFLLFVFSSQIRNLWLLLADLKIHSAPNLFSYVSFTFIVLIILFWYHYRFIIAWYRYVSDHFLLSNETKFNCTLDRTSFSGFPSLFFLDVYFFVVTSL